MADTLSRSKAKAWTMMTDDKRITIIRDARDGVDTESWISIINRAQQSDESLQQALVEETEFVHRRDGLVRIRYPESDKIALPDKIIWRMIEKNPSVFNTFWYRQGTRIREAILSRK